MKLLFNDKSCIFVCLIQWISSSELNAFLDCMCAKMDSANLFHRSSTEEKCWICCNLTVSPFRLLDELECSHCVCSYGCLRSVILQWIEVKRGLKELVSLTVSSTFVKLENQKLSPDRSERSALARAEF